MGDPAAPDAMLSHYREIAREQLRDPRKRARHLVRHAVLDSLSAAEGLIGSVDRHLARPRIHFLYLHHVLLDEEAQFRALLRRLAERHTFLSYSDAVERLGQGVIDRPYIAFSFDDGMRNSLRAAELLGEVGATACFFICTSMVEETRFARIREFSATELHIPPAPFLTWNDCELLIRQGHEIGNHSARHKTLRDVSPQELQDDVAGSLELLRARLGDVKHFAWPRGRFSHMSADAAREVFRAGHVSCASAERGAHVAAARGRSLCIRRDHVVAHWPVRHSLWFLARSSKRATAANNDWPPGWLPRIEEGA
jgi:peptidoglycan/xylan/chitin deacetylase (PgdA/CDA1 family)